MGWLTSAECVCVDCPGESQETGRFDGLALSSGSGARSVRACSRGADSQWCDLSVVCPTGDIGLCS